MMRSHPLPNIDRCDCRIQILDALRLEVQTWTIGTAPDVDVWMDECAAWIAELPNETLAQGWMAALVNELNTYAGVAVSIASPLLQRHVGEAMLAKAKEART